MPQRSPLAAILLGLLLAVSGCNLGLDSPDEEESAAGADTPSDDDSNDDNSESDLPETSPTDPLDGAELDPDSDDFDYPGDEYAGRVVVTLHPQAAVEPDKNREVVFAVPFPRGWLEKADSVSLHDGSGEIPVHVEELTRWPDPEDGSGSIRAVRVTLEEAFSSRDPLTLELRWGGARKQELGEPVTPDDTWIPIDESGVDESEYTT
ncbi:hypothetical protein, partial [Thiohalospira sp.]|uniref:hypothetical protein n=1 Tax=Thiohalospira sp. TaxID=3080549 RepID=UPI0039806928